VSVPHSVDKPYQVFTILPDVDLLWEGHWNVQELGKVAKHSAVQGVSLVVEKKVLIAKQIGECLMMNMNAIVIFDNYAVKFWVKLCFSYIHIC
jgi:hypothetical protein